MLGKAGGKVFWRGHRKDLREILWIQRFWAKNKFVFPFLKRDRCLGRTLAWEKSLFLTLSHTKSIHSLGQVGDVPEENNKTLTEMKKPPWSSRHGMLRRKLTWAAGPWPDSLEISWSCDHKRRLWRLWLSFPTCKMTDLFRVFLGSVFPDSGHCEDRAQQKEDVISCGAVLKNHLPQLWNGEKQGSQNAADAVRGQDSTPALASTVASEARLRGWELQLESHLLWDKTLRSPKN